uniref:Thyroid hormone receptor interactor 11 n=1 Tax=Hucho hucho TaxID=62062 RepID=A0A4W5M3J3_9TELE
MMQQRDVEISHLKARQSGLQEEVQKLQHSAQSATSDPAVLPVTTASTTATSSSYMSRPLGGALHQGFHGSDEMDFSDVIWSQQEINRLSTELMRLEAEVSHWRRVSQASIAPGAGNGDQGEVLKLQRIIKELREEMGREVDEHQHELAALQDAQRQKMADITRRHRDELAEYEERIEELEEQKQTGDTSPATANALQESSTLSDLQNTIQSLQEAAEEQEEKLKEQLKELTANLEEAGRSRATLQQEKEEAQAESAELLQNYTRLQTSVTELQSRVQEQEGKARNKAQLDQEIQGLRKALAGAEKEISRLKSLQSDAKMEVEHADILELNTIIGTLRKEKESVEQDKRNLQERLARAEERVESDSLDGGESSPAATEQVSGLRAELEKSEQSLREVQEERETLLNELEELDRQNQQATQVWFELHWGF